MPKTKVRPKHEKHLLNDNQRMIIVVLSKLGGFSTRAIACRIFNTDNPTKGELESVSGYRSRQQIKLRWWRDGESVLSKRYMQARVSETIKAKR